MARRRTNSHLLPPPPANEGTLSRLSAYPWLEAPKKPPSDFATKVIEHNRDMVIQLARVSALQALPILLSRGEKGTLGNVVEDLTDCIDDLIRQAIDEKEGHVQEMKSIFNIEIMYAQQEGEEFTDKARNRNILEVDISIPLENGYLYFPAETYTRGRKLVEKWFS